MKHRTARMQFGRAAHVAALLAPLIAAGGAQAQERGGGAALAAQAAPTTIDAQSIESVSDIELSARGAVELRRGDASVFTESLKFNRELGRLEAEGGVRLQRGTDRFFGPRLRYNLNDDTGEFEQPSYLLQRRQTARGAAERIEFLGRDHLKLTRASFTTCSPGNDDWVFEVAELELDYENEEARATSPRLRLLDTTLLALPYATLPLENRRRSGLLTPRYSQSTLRGGELAVPFYWNIAPEVDATLTPVVMTKRGNQLKTQARYLGGKYGGEVQLDYMPDDRELQASRHRGYLFHKHELAPNLVGQVDLSRVSDYRYFVDFSTQVQQVSVANVPRNGLLSYSGSNAGWAYGAALRVQRFQTLQDPVALIEPPYHRVPQLNGSLARNDLGGFADLAVPVEYVQFVHPTMVEGVRVTLNPTLAVPVRAPGWFLTPKLGVRYADYDLTRTAPTQPPKQHVSIPWLSIDGGLAFEREARWFGQQATQTFEPRIFYVYAPYRDQDRLPLFDTGLNDFNYAQIFTENRFSGGDRFGDANEVTLAATTRWLLPGAREAFRATIGERLYFDDERVPLAPGAPLRTHRDSDILTSVGGRISGTWLFDATSQYNPRDRYTQRHSWTVRYTPEPGKALNTSYRFKSYRFDPNAQGQIDIAGQWPIAGGWYAVGRYNYSLLDRRVLEGLSGFEYNGGCWVFRGVIQRIQATTEITSTALYLQIEFNGFGQVGTEEAVRLLRRNVPGYAVTNPSDPGLVPPSLQHSLPFEQRY